MSFSLRNLVSEVVLYVEIALHPLGEGRFPLAAEEPTNRSTMMRSR